MKRLLVGLVMIGSVGCAQQRHSFKLTLSTTTPTTPKVEPCDFRVVNLLPRGPFEEIATLNRVAWVDAVGTPDVFKKVVHDDVCRVGGAVVVTEINGGGEYVRGTVLREVPNQASNND